MCWTPQAPSAAQTPAPPLPGVTLNGIAGFQPRVRRAQLGTETAIPGIKVPDPTKLMK